MAQVRNISGAARPVPHLGSNVVVDPDEMLTIPDADLWPEGLAADSAEGLAYAAANPNARNWRIPGVWEVAGDPPPVVKPAPKPESAPTDAPSE